MGVLSAAIGTPARLRRCPNQRTLIHIRVSVLLLAITCLNPGCTLRELRSKTKTGIEFRHSGSRRTDRQRFTVQQGLEFRWDNGVSTAVSYRRRDDDDGPGDRDDGVFFDIGIPIWKAASSVSRANERIQTLEGRIAALEELLHTGGLP